MGAEKDSAIHENRKAEKEIRKVSVMSLMKTRQVS